MSANSFSFWKSLKFVVWERVKLLIVEHEKLYKPLTLWQNQVLFKSNAFADNTINETENIKSFIENIVEKGENAGYLNFLLYPHVFEKTFFLKFGLCGKGLIQMGKDIFYQYHGTGTSRYCFDDKFPKYTLVVYYSLTSN